MKTQSAPAQVPALPAALPPFRSWLWPDHVAGKRETRRLRDEHNALINARAELVAALGCILDAVDYTAKACRPNEMVGAVLPPVLIANARSTLARL